MLISCKIVRDEVFNIFVVVSVPDTNFTVVAADINVRDRDDLMNGNRPQAVVCCGVPETLPIVFSLTREQLKTHQTLPVC
jgi:hypothetical protein